MTHNVNAIRAKYHLRSFRQMENSGWHAKTARIRHLLCVLYEFLLDCRLCTVPRGFDPEAETKELPAILIEDKKPRVGQEDQKK